MSETPINEVSDTLDALAEERERECTCVLKRVGGFARSVVSLSGQHYAIDFGPCHAVSQARLAAANALLSQAEEALRAIEKLAMVRDYGYDFGKLAHEALTALAAYREGA
jgi:hypothetical protein